MDATQTTLRQLHESKEAAWTNYNTSRLQWHTAEKKALKNRAIELTDTYKKAKADGMGWDVTPAPVNEKSHSVQKVTLHSAPTTRFNDPCPRCGTYCYGDCTA